MAMSTMRWPGTLRCFGTVPSAGRPCDACSNARWIVAGLPRLWPVKRAPVRRHHAGLQGAITDLQLLLQPAAFHLLLHLQRSRSRSAVSGKYRAFTTRKRQWRDIRHRCSGSRLTNLVAGHRPRAADGLRVAARSAGIDSFNARWGMLPYCGKVRRRNIGRVGYPGFASASLQYRRKQEWPGSAPKKPNISGDRTYLRLCGGAVSLRRTRLHRMQWGSGGQGLSLR